MNSYAPGLFRKLDEHDTMMFRDAANADFDDAVDEIVVKAVHHPIYRLQLAKRICDHANEELEQM